MVPVKFTLKTNRAPKDPLTVASVSSLAGLAVHLVVQTGSTRRVLVFALLAQWLLTGMGWGYCRSVVSSHSVDNCCSFLIVFNNSSHKLRLKGTRTEILTYY